MNKKIYHKINLNTVGADNPVRPTNEKGITLIALIITIIVILILVAVSVRTISKSGLFDHAKDATNKWADAQEKEANIGDGPIEINGIVYDSIDDYVKRANEKVVEPENIEDWEYEVDEETGMLIITNYKGTDTEVVIPNYINGKKVIAVGTHENTDPYVSTWKYMSLWDEAICDGLVKGEMAGEKDIIKVTISEGIKYIFPNTFNTTISLREVILPDSIIEIGGGAFSGCESLTNVKLPNKLEYIGQYAFNDCTNLGTIFIPKSVREIGESTFSTGGIYYNPGDIIVNVECQEDSIPDTWSSNWNAAGNGTVTVNYGVTK